MLYLLVARRLGDLSSQEGRDLVKAGAVYMGHLRVRVPTVRVVPGERITVYPNALQHQPLPSASVKFVHRDPAFVVLDKPCGVPVVQTKQSARGTLSEALRRVLMQEGLKRPYVGVVHRLDRGASGLVLFTVRDIANKSLHRQFVDHSIQRDYRTMVQGKPPATLRCDAPLADLRDGKVRVAPSSPRARPAETTLRRLVASNDAPANQTLLQASLHTGRMHQIRVHLAHLGYPVVGDTKYGEKDQPPTDPPGTLMLHAFRLEFDHPISGDRLEVVSTPPTWAESEDA